VAPLDSFSKVSVSLTTADKWYGLSVVYVSSVNPAYSAVPFYIVLKELTLDSYQPQNCQAVHAHCKSSGGAFTYMCLTFWHWNLAFQF
jgi:hypothetical protein